MSRDRKKEEESDISHLLVAGGLALLGAAVGAGAGYWAGKKLLNRGRRRPPMEFGRQYLYEESDSSGGTRRPPMEFGRQYLFEESDSSGGTRRPPMEFGRQYLYEESDSSGGTRRPPMEFGRQYLYEESDSSGGTRRPPMEFGRQYLYEESDSSGGTRRPPMEFGRQYLYEESDSSGGTRRSPMELGRQYLYVDSDDESDDDGVNSLSRRMDLTYLEPSSQRQWVREKPLEVGVRFNKWRKPEAFFGPTEHHMDKQIAEKLGLGALDIDPDVWRKATDMADKMLEMLFSEVVKIAAEYRLTIDKFVRKGSAREGLKVCDANEFDVLLQFSIDGLKFEVQQETDTLGRPLPEFGKLRVTNPARYDKLRSANVFTVKSGSTYLNSRNLHEKVFTSIIDKARHSVLNELRHDDCDITIDRAINQPAIKISIKMKTREPGFNIDEHIEKSHKDFGTYFVVQSGGGTRKSRIATVQPANLHAPQQAVNLDVDIDIDIVPALLICYDQVPDPAASNCTMDCPRYAVFKWVRDNHPFVRACDVQPETIWRMDSSGYEKHVLDVARCNTDQRYILTAQRVLKAYFLSASQAAQQPQLVTVMRTYFLKQLAFYCILFYTVINKLRITGVRQALTILIDLLEICLTKRRLPHFFHTNRLLLRMFPDYHIEPGALRYDVFHTISRDALVQAKLDVGRHLRPMFADFTCDLGDGALAIEDEFRQFIEEGDYFDPQCAGNNQNVYAYANTFDQDQRMSSWAAGLRSNPFDILRQNKAFSRGRKLFSHQNSRKLQYKYL